LRTFGEDRSSLAQSLIDDEVKEESKDQAMPLRSSPRVPAELLNRPVSSKKDRRATNAEFMYVLLAGGCAEEVAEAKKVLDTGNQNQLTSLPPSTRSKKESSKASRNIGRFTCNFGQVYKGLVSTNLKKYTQKDTDQSGIVMTGKQSSAVSEGGGLDISLTPPRQRKMSIQRKYLLLAGG